MTCENMYLCISTDFNYTLRNGIKMKVFWFEEFLGLFNYESEHLMTVNVGSKLCKKNMVVIDINS